MLVLCVGFVCWFCLLVLFVGGQSFKVMTEYWLAVWSEEQYEVTFGLTVYGALVFATVVFIQAGHYSTGIVMIMSRKKKRRSRKRQFLRTRKLMLIPNFFGAPCKAPKFVKKLFGRLARRPQQFNISVSLRVLIHVYIDTYIQTYERVQK